MQGIAYTSQRCKYERHRKTQMCQTRGSFHIPIYHFPHGLNHTAIPSIPWDVGIPWNVKESLNTGTNPNKDVRAAASHASDLHKSRYEFLGCRRRIQLKSMEEACSVAALAHALSANSTLQSPSLNFGYTTEHHKLPTARSWTIFGPLSGQICIII